MVGCYAKCQGQPSIETAQGSSSVRAPSATMALALVGQVQFLATLSLVDTTGAEASYVLDFAENLRCEGSRPRIPLFGLSYRYPNSR